MYGISKLSKGLDYQIRILKRNISSIIKRIREIFRKTAITKFQNSNSWSLSWINATSIVLRSCFLSEIWKKCDLGRYRISHHTAEKQLFKMRALLLPWESSKGIYLLKFLRTTNIIVSKKQGSKLTWIVLF